MISASGPNSAFASCVLIIRISLSVGILAASASAPLLMSIPVEIMSLRSGIVAGSSVTTYSVPLRRYSLSKMVHPGGNALARAQFPEGVFRYAMKFLSLTWYMGNHPRDGNFTSTPFYDISKVLRGRLKMAQILRRIALKSAPSCRELRGRVRP